MISLCLIIDLNVNTRDYTFSIIQIGSSVKILSKLTSFHTKNLNFIRYLILIACCFVAKGKFHLTDRKKYPQEKFDPVYFAFEFELLGNTTKFS